jgi:hypothetical protein
MDNRRRATVPYQRHSATSRAAADRVTPGVATAERRVLRALSAAGRGGLTDEEISDITGLRQETARARRVRLVQIGCVMDSGQKRRTSTGCYATVWVYRTAEQLTFLGLRGVR